MNRKSKTFYAQMTFLFTVIIQFISLTNIAFCQSLYSSLPDMPLLMLDFEGDLVGSHGETPQVSNEVYFYSSPEGQGIRVSATGELEYAVDGNLNHLGGMIDLWVQRKWELDHDVADYFFNIGRSDTDGISLYRDVNNTLRFKTNNSDSGYGVYIDYNISDWEMDSWHHIQAVWGYKGTELYINDVLVGSNTDEGNYWAPKAFDLPISVGCKYIYYGSDCVIDNFKIYEFLPTFLVGPEDDTTFSGFEGSFFIPYSSEYILSATNTTEVDWYIESWSGNWFTLSATEGTILNGATDTLSISTNSNAQGLSVGTYSGYFIIETASGEKFRRDINLEVKANLESLYSSLPDFPILMLDFEGDLIGSDGEIPLVSEEISFYPSPEGQGIRVSTTGELEYAVEDNIDPSCGLIDLWVQRKWELDHGEADYFFKIGRIDGDGIALYREVNNKLRFVSVNSTVGYGVYITYDISYWEMDSWHHVQAVWGDEGTELYVEGVLVGTNTDDGNYLPPEEFNLPISVGCKYIYYGSDCVIDNFKVFDFKPTLIIEPEEDNIFSGAWGGPFTPTANSYVLSATNTSEVNWHLDSWSGDWFTLSATQGTILNGATEDIYISTKSNADSFFPGMYSGYFLIKTDIGELYKRNVILEVQDTGFMGLYSSLPDVPLLMLDFEGDLIGDDGEIPSSSDGVSFSSTPWGEGITVLEPGKLEYDIEDNIERTGGMVDLWVQKKWEDTDSSSHYFFVVGSIGQGGILIYRNPWDHLYFTTKQYGTSWEMNISYDIQSWEMDTWHHIQAIWGYNGTELYIDGLLVGSNPAGGDYYPPDSLEKPIAIGCNPSDSTYPWSNCVIDNVKIYGFTKTFLVEPEETNILSGLEGGSFTPASDQYILSATNTTSVYWYLDSWSGDWFTLSATQGTILSGATEALNLSANTYAESLDTGTYQGHFIIATDYGEKFKRDIQLRVLDTEFEWEMISDPPLFVDEPFSVRITAKDSDGNVIPDFSGTVDLSGEIIGDAITSATIEWSTPVGGLYNVPYAETYNYFTNHFLVSYYSGYSDGAWVTSVGIVDAETGLLTDKELSLEGLQLGQYGIFGICVDEKGVIYGGTTLSVDGITPCNSLVRWENEDAVPTQQDPGTPFGVGMEFPRVMDAIGSGENTVIAVTGSEDFQVTFLTTTDGINFSVTDFTPSGGVNRKPDGTSYVYGLFKQGVALDPKMDRIFGTKADGWGEVACLVKDESANWIAPYNFSPPLSYTSPPDGLGGACTIGYSDWYNTLFVFGYKEETNDYMTLLDADTGAKLFQFPMGVDIRIYGYGGFDLSDYEGTGYFGASSPNESGGRFACGKVNYESDNTPITFTPMVTGNFVNGEWTGTLTIPIISNRIVLRADDENGNYGYSDMISIHAKLDVTPNNSFEISDTIGSVYSPDSKTYNLTNLDLSPINWTASKTSNWINLSTESGTLSPGVSVYVDVSLDNSVYNLPAGTYYDTVTFTDTTNTMQQTRNVVISLTESSTEPDTTPPAITQGPIVTYTNENSAIVEWQTDEPATSVVNYGKWTGLGSTVSDPELIENHRIALTGLESNRIYFLKVASTDGEGNGPTESWMISFYTLSNPDTSAPVIFMGPQALNVTDTEADIRWYTDEPASSAVTYNGGIDSGFVEEATPYFGHYIHLSGLTPNTIYDYVVASTDTQGNGPTISSATFMTLPTHNPDGPVITFGPYAFHTTHNAAWIFWLTNEPARSAVQYGEAQSLGNQIVQNNYSRLHLMRIGGLESNTDYYYRVLATDRDGNGPTISDIYPFHTKRFHDTHKPVFVSGPSVVHKTDTTATIYWMTDELADTGVNYGTALPLNNHRIDPDKKTEHRMTLVNLSPGQNYLIECTSTDMSGNIASTSESFKKKSGGISFTTNLDPDVEAPVINDGPTVVYKTDTMAIIYWETDEIADSGIYYNEFGEPLIMFEGDIEHVFEHCLSLTGLNPGTTYSFKVLSDDISRNGPTSSAVVNFTTELVPDQTAPVLEGSPGIENISPYLAVVNWKTDEYATSYIEYGSAISELYNIAGLNGFRTDHEVTLTNLEGGYIYYRIISQDLSGNRLESEIKGFSTSGSLSIDVWEIYK